MVVDTVKFRNKSRGLYFSKTLFEGLIFGRAYIRRDLSTEGHLRFTIDWASLIFESKFTVFALFYFVFESNFPRASPRGAYIWGGLYLEGLIFGILRYDGTNLFSLSLIYLYVYFYMFISLQIQVIGPQKQLNTSVLIVHLSNHETMRTTTCLLVGRGRVLSITVYTGRPRPQGVPFSCFLCMKG